MDLDVGAEDDGRGLLAEVVDQGDGVGAGPAVDVLKFCLEITLGKKLGLKFIDFAELFA